MNILLLTTHLNIGGVGVYTVNLAKALKKEGVSAYVASAGGELLPVLKKNHIPHIKAAIKTKCEFHPKLIPAFFALRKVVKKYKVDVIHAQTRVAQVLGYFLSRSAGVPFVATCHGFFKESRPARRVFAAWGDRTIAISDAVKEHLLKDFGLKENTVHLIYTGIECEKFAPGARDGFREDGIGEKGLANHPVVGTVTRLSPVKGLKYLIFAVKDIMRRTPEVRLLFVGEGPEKASLISLVKNLGMEENVFFAPNTADTAKYLNIMDVFVFYSLEEGLGLSLLEAMAAGRPCVASCVGGVPSVMEDGKNGILVPPKDQDALKKAISRLLEEKDFARELAENARNLVKRKFTLDKMVKEVIDVYKKAQETA